MNFDNGMDIQAFHASRGRGANGHASAKLFMFIILAVFVSVVLVMAFGAYVSNWLASSSQIPNNPATSQTAGNQPTTQLIGAPIYGTVNDNVTGASLGGTSAKIDVINPGSLSRVAETITVSTTSKTFTSSGFYTPGQTLILHAYSTEGNGYYDSVQTITVPSALTSINGGAQVYSIGKLYLEQRVTAANVNFLLYSPTGATLSSGTGAAAGTAGTYTASTTSFQLSYAITLSSLSVGWGVPEPTLSSSFVQQTRVAVGWLAINNTAVSSSQISNDGWTSINNPPQGWLVFYKVLPPVESTSSKQGGMTPDYFTVDTSSIASGKHIGVDMWFQDLQLPADAALGTSDGAPTAYGAYSGYGLASVIGTGYTTNTSGDPTSPLLSAVITTG